MIVADRCAPLLLATVKFTVPFPEPLEPDVIVIQLSLGTAVQLQLPPADTLKLPLPPEPEKFWLVELSDVTHAVFSKKEEILE